MRRPARRSFPLAAVACALLACAAAAYLAPPLVRAALEGAAVEAEREGKPARARAYREIRASLFD